MYANLAQMPENKSHEKSQRQKRADMMKAYKKDNSFINAFILVTLLSVLLGVMAYATLNLQS